MENTLEKLLDISGKTVLITGATGYFGRYIAESFVTLGAKVILMARSDKLDQLVKDLQASSSSDRVVGYQVDFYDIEALKTTLQKVIKEHKIDVLINNAYDLSPRTGFNTPEGRLEVSPKDHWQAAFEAGIYWPVIATQIVGEVLKRNGGSIINISSMYGIVSPDPKLYEGNDKFNPPTYSVVKAGLIGLTRYTAAFWAKYGVRCNALAPGPFPNIESNSSNSVDSDDDFLQRVKANTMLNRFGHPLELIGALVFLASDSSKYMTGQVLPIDGGWTAW